MQTILKVRNGVARTFVRSQEGVRHLNKKFNDLSRFEGEPLRIIAGIDLYAKPESVVFVRDYGKAVLIKMKFVADKWHPINPKPRYVTQLISKASLAVGDVKIVSAITGERIYWDAVAPFWLTPNEALIHN